jgi:CRP-like cAMP-binding protein
MPPREVDFSLLARAGYPIQEFDGGEVIFSDGDGGDYMFLVRSGSVEIIRNRAVVKTVGPGGIFGEMALIDGSPRSAGGRSKGPAIWLQFLKKAFSSWCMKPPILRLM